MQSTNPDSFSSIDTLTVGARTYAYARSGALEAAGFDLRRMPYSMKILLENLLRYEDGVTVKKDDVAAVAGWDPEGAAFARDRVPAGARAVARLHRRPGGRRLGGDARRDGRDGQRPRGDQSAAAGRTRHRPFGAGRQLSASPSAFAKNVELEFGRNKERYAFLKWGQHALRNYRAVPPGTGHRASSQRRVS